MSLYEATQLKSPSGNALESTCNYSTNVHRTEKFSTSWKFIMEQHLILLNKEIRDLYVLKLLWRMITWKYEVLELLFSTFSVVHLVVSDSVTPWTAARQASLSITNSQNLLRLRSKESVMPSNHLILCHLLLLPSVFPSIRVFSFHFLIFFIYFY